MNKYGELKELGFRFDHSASERGYISRKIDYKIVPYIGRFGIGVKVIFPRNDTTQYVDIEYHIMDSGILKACNNDNGIIYKFHFDHFKNGKKMYRFTKNGCENALDKNIFNVRLKEWDYLCN